MVRCKRSALPNSTSSSILAGFFDHIKPSIAPTTAMEDNRKRHLNAKGTRAKASRVTKSSTNGT